MLALPQSAPALSLRLNLAEDENDLHPHRWTLRLASPRPAAALASAIGRRSVGKTLVPRPFLNPLVARLSVTENPAILRMLTMDATLQRERESTPPPPDRSTYCALVQEVIVTSGCEKRSVRTGLRRFLTCATIGAIAGVLSGPAVARPGADDDVVLQHSSLAFQRRDLDTASGALAMLARIKIAATAACGGWPSWYDSPLLDHRFRDRRRDAINGAIRAINAPRLSKLSEQEEPTSRPWTKGAFAVAGYNGTPSSSP